MDWSIVGNYIFGNVTPEFYFSFYLFAIIGMTFSMLVDFQRYKSKKKKANEKVNFNFKYWIKRNTVRMLTNIIAIFILIRFPENLKIATQLSMFIAFMAGTSIDALITIIKNIKIGSAE
jgi:hypothetical protein